MSTSDIIATVEFLSAEEGGRETPTPQMRIGCIFVMDGIALDCYLMLENHPPINPGETATIPIFFIDPLAKKLRFGIGTRFQLRDHRLIANGLINKSE